MTNDQRVWAWLAGMFITFTAAKALEVTLRGITFPARFFGKLAALATYLGLGALAVGIYKIASAIQEVREDIAISKEIREKAKLDLKESLYESRVQDAQAQKDLLEDFMQEQKDKGNTKLLEVIQDGKESITSEDKEQLSTGNIRQRASTICAIMRRPVKAESKEEVASENKIISELPDSPEALFTEMIEDGMALQIAGISISVDNVDAVLDAEDGQDIYIDVTPANELERPIMDEDVYIDVTPESELELTEMDEGEGLYMEIEPADSSLLGKGPAGGTVDSVTQNIKAVSSEADGGKEVNKGATNDGSEDAPVLD